MLTYNSSTSRKHVSDDCRKQVLCDITILTTTGHGCLIIIVKIREVVVDCKIRISTSLTRTLNRVCLCQACN